MAFYARRKLVARQHPELDNREVSLPAHRFGVCKGLKVAGSRSKQAMSQPDQHRQKRQGFNCGAPFASLS